MMDGWVGILVGGILSGGALTGVLVFIATRKRDNRSDIAERFDDASQLAQYIREEVERQVEIQVAPMRDELKKVKTESHEMHDAVRARETQLWLWDLRGRPGVLPMLPGPILERLGLAHLLNDPHLEDTVPVTKEPK